MRSDRRVAIPSGLAERIDRVRGEEAFEHWARHQLEAAVLQRERARGLVTEQQRNQIQAQDAALEDVRDRLDQKPG